MGPIEKARAAERLRDDDLFREVIDRVRGRQIKTFLNDRSTQDEREQAHVLIRAISAIEGELKSIIDAGTVAKKKDQHRGSD